MENDERGFLQKLMEDIGEGAAEFGGGLLLTLAAMILPCLLLWLVVMIATAGG